MAKKNNPDNHTRKKPGAGAAFGSVLLFLLTFLSAILLLVSASVHTALTNGALAAAVEKTDFTKASVTDDGKTQSFGSWLHECYMWNSENLTPAYGEAVSAQPEFSAFFSGYLNDLGAYLLKDSDEMPQLDAAALCDVLQYEIADDMQKETGILFAEADRTAVLYNAEDDFSDWNEAVYDLSGHGFGKFMTRFFCTLPGVITAAVMTGVFFLLWLILAIHGGWRKGRMLTASGTAIAVPSLLVLLGSGILLLLVNVFDCIPDLSFTANGLPTLLQPFLWVSAVIALCGMLIASVGICTNSVVKSKARRARLAEAAEAAQPAAPETPVVPTQPEFTYSQIQDTPAAAAPVPEKSSAFCPHCGAENEPGSKFCGSCGGTL